MKYCVYKHTFPNGKIYIGITSMEPVRRWANGFGYKKQPSIFNAKKKYGWNNIQHEVIVSGLSKEDAEKAEIELIERYGSNQKDYGYNVSNGGNTTGTMAGETKQKISQTLKGVPKKKSPFKGKKHSEQAKAKLRAARIGDRNPMYGKHLTEDTKKKMSESHKKGNLCKEIVCVETGEIFISASDVARKMGLSQGNVSSVARGQRKHTKGFHFVYTGREAVDGEV